jgi:hypothetical protein
LIRKSFLFLILAPVERRHDRGMLFKDEVVLQVSKFKWLVQSASEVGLQYKVERDEDFDEEEHGPELCGDCIDVNSGYDEGMKSEESYCLPCGICSCFYTCNCPDKHTLCKHVHKVHTFNEKVKN